MFIPEKPKAKEAAGTPPAGAPHAPLEFESWRDSLRSSSATPSIT